jgi:diguanylate cyclase (GGDEF)-like protein
MTDVFIDLRTLSFVLMLVTALMASVMFVIWKTQKTYPGVGYWTVANLVAAGAFFLIALRGSWPEIISVIAGSSLAVASLAIAYEGNRRFRGLDPQYWLSAGVVVVNALVLAFFTYAFPDLFARIAVVSGSLFVIALACFLLFWRAPQPQHHKLPYRLVSLTYLAFAAVMAVRIAATYAYSDLYEFFTPDWIQSVLFMSFIVFAIIWTFNYVILNNERLHTELRTAEAELVKLATTDYLTGLANNRAFFEFAVSEIKRSRRHRFPMTLVVFDLDLFKNINDTYGHAAGDLVLKELADLTRRIIRQSDLVARIGGEEFAMILTHADLARGRVVAENFRYALEHSEFVYEGVRIPVTASFGVAEMRPSDTVSSLLTRADENLYQAKAEGRNRIGADSGTNGLRLISRR